MPIKLHFTNLDLKREENVNRTFEVERDNIVQKQRDPFHQFA